MNGWSSYSLLSKTPNGCTEHITWTLDGSLQLRLYKSISKNKLQLVLKRKKAFNFSVVGDSAVQSCWVCVSVLVCGVAIKGPTGQPYGDKMNRIGLGMFFLTLETNNVLSVDLKVLTNVC